MTEDRVPEWTKPVAKDVEHLTLYRAEAIEARLALIEKRLPNTRLLEKKFLSRAFTVVGHEIVAYLVLLSPIYVVLLALLVLESLGITNYR